VPTTVIGAVSFDHAIGAREDRVRNRDTERFRGFEIDRELDARRLFDWQVGRRAA
jgi:hypothetical protein